MAAHARLKNHIYCADFLSYRGMQTDLRSREAADIIKKMPDIVVVRYES